MILCLVQNKNAICYLHDENRIIITYNFLKFHGRLKLFKRKRIKKYILYPIYINKSYFHESTYYVNSIWVRLFP